MPAYALQYAQASVSDAGIELYERGSRIEHAAHVVGRHHASRADDRIDAARFLVYVSHGGYGALGQRSAAYSALAPCIGILPSAVETVSREGARDGHYAVERQLYECRHYFVELFVRKVGGYFEQYRTVVELTAAELEQRRQQLLYALSAREHVALGRGVAGDVDGKVIDILIHVAEHFQVVACGRLVGCYVIFGDVAADDDPLVPVADVAHGIFQALVGVARAVEYGVVGLYGEYARTRTSRLRTRRDGSYLDEAEACGRQLLDRVAVGIVPGRDADGVGKAHAEHLAFEIGRTQRVTLRQQPFASGQGACCAQCRKGGVVCRFGIQQRERGPCRRIFHP